MKQAIRGLAMLLALAACDEVAGPVETGAPVARTAGAVGVATLKRVASDVIPVAEARCRSQAPSLNCSYIVVLDEDPRTPPNAFQSMAKDGRPQITVTQSLLDDLRNSDELAFVLGHESAHYIRGHLTKTATNATLGAIAGGLIVGALGGDYAAIDTAQRAGATVGGRAYSKDYELEADRLGAVITLRAGHDPVRGAEYFTRIADPGNAFLGTHPPNADRIKTVREAVAGL